MSCPRVFAFLVAAIMLVACGDHATVAGPQRAATGAANKSTGVGLADAGGASLNVANAQDVAQLYELQATYHAAASVRDPVNGDSPTTIADRIREMLSLWAPDGMIRLGNGTGPRDGLYLGLGDPADPTTCPAPSGNPALRGTLCSFFKYVAGSFQPQNRFVSLASSYKTHFDVQGATGTLYFECHYFDVSTSNPSSSNNAPWTAKTHAVATGQVRRVDGRWKLQLLDATVPPPPIPVGR